MIPFSYSIRLLPCDFYPWFLFHGFIYHLIHFEYDFFFMHGSFYKWFIFHLLIFHMIHKWVFFFTWLIFHFFIFHMIHNWFTFFYLIPFSNYSLFTWFTNNSFSLLDSFFKWFFFHLLIFQMIQFNSRKVREQFFWTSAFGITEIPGMWFQIVVETSRLRGRGQRGGTGQ